MIPLPHQNESEHRYHKRLRAYWEHLRGSRPFPSENEIEPDDLEEIWPSCFLISIDNVTHRLGYRYSYLGADLMEAYGCDSGNADIAGQMLSTSDLPTVKKFDDIRQIKKPLLDESEFVNAKNVTIKYRAILVPLGYEDGQVSHILGCMRWAIG